MVAAVLRKHVKWVFFKWKLEFWTAILNAEMLMLHGLSHLLSPFFLECHWCVNGVLFGDVLVHPFEVGWTTTHWQRGGLVARPSRKIPTLSMYVANLRHHQVLVILVYFGIPNFCWVVGILQSWKDFACFQMTDGLQTHRLEWRDWMSSWWCLTLLVPAFEMVSRFSYLFSWFLDYFFCIT